MKPEDEIAPDARCAVEDCDRPRRSRGWCRMHYQRWWKTGTTDDLRALALRFWSKVDKEGPLPESRPDLGQCWIWTASRYDGYGQFSLTRTTKIRAHRWAYQQMVGLVPDGLQLDHLCRNRACINPAHLEPVTPRENTLRSEAVTAKLARATECQNGHAKTPENMKVRADGTRSCRLCNNVRNRRYAKARRTDIERGGA